MQHNKDMRRGMTTSAWAIALCLVFALIIGWLGGVRPAQACCTCGQVAQDVNTNTEARLLTHRTWTNFTLWPRILADLKQMEDQLANNGFAVAGLIAKLEDAVQHNRVAFAKQEMTYESQRRYRPSDQLCTMATLKNGLSASDDSSKLMQSGIHRFLMDRLNGTAGSIGANGRDGDFEARWQTYLSDYCSPRDENGALGDLCRNDDPTFHNRDISYATVVGFPNTIKTEDVDTVLQLGMYLIGNELPYSRPLAKDIDPNKNPDGNKAFHDQRAVVAMQSLPLWSFSSIVALKAEGPAESADSLFYMRNMMRKLGYSEAYINKELDVSPSYYARMNLLADALTVNPEAPIQNIDTPSHVQTNIAVIRSIDNMLMHQVMESQKRQEMLTSAWMEARVREDQSAVSRLIAREAVEGQRRPQ